MEVLQMIKSIMVVTTRDGVGKDFLSKFKAEYEKDFIGVFITDPDLKLENFHVKIINIDKMLNMDCK